MIPSPWLLPMTYDDSSSDRARFAALCAEGVARHAPNGTHDGPATVAPSTQGCRVCGDLEIAVHNDNGRFCGEHWRQGMEWRNS